MKFFDATMLWGRMNDAQRGGQLECERIKPERQPLAYGLEGGFLEGPELEERVPAGRPFHAFDSLSLRFREVSLRKSCGVEVPPLIFDIHTDAVRCRPGAEKAEAAG